MGGWCRVCVGLAAATAAAVAGVCGCAQVSPGATEDDRVGGAGAPDGGAPGGGKGDGSGCGPLDTLANCGSCGHACLAAGGTTRCVASGATWVCQPSCDATHGDCDGNPANGCESTLDTSAHCGACGRACSTTGATSTSCQAGVCAPVCATARSDCSRPAAPAPDDGCETDATTDPGEFDNRCSGAASLTVPEGQRETVSGHRILPIGDLDTLHVHLIEASHDCVPLAGQSYRMRIDLTPPPGVDLRLAYNLNACDDSWSLGFTTAICVSWSGTCIANDDRDFWFQVYGSGSSNSCLPYTIDVQYANEGESIPGCN